MKSREFIKKIENGEPINGYYIVCPQYLCLDFVEKPFTGTLRIWGYYPYKITGFGIKPAGKIYFKVEIIDKLGLVTEKRKSIKSKFDKLDWDRHNEYYSTEEEAIEECKLRNRGKKGPGPCSNVDLTKWNGTYRAEKFY